LKEEGDAGTAQHAPWATSVGHGARIVREAEPRSGRGRACLGTLSQPGTTARALRCPPLRARETRRPQAHPRRAWRQTVSQRPPPPPEAATTHVLISHTWPLVAQPQRGHGQQYACLRCASRANRCVGRKPVRADTADMDTVGALQRGKMTDKPCRTAAGRTGSERAPCVGQGARALSVRSTPACRHGRSRARRGLVCRRPMHSKSRGAMCRQTVLARSATYTGLSDPGRMSNRTNNKKATIIRICS